MTDSSDGRDLLAQRARNLARPLTEREFSDGAGTSGPRSLLVVRVSGERVGIPLDHIIEVYRTTALMPIPGAGPPVLGVIAWRGRVLTVMDIAHDRSGPVIVTDATRFLVLGQRRGSFGIVADDVEDVQDVNMQDASPVDGVAPMRRDIVHGVMPDALVVLDAAALIARFATTH